jgi:hypothetical protein
MDVPWLWKKVTSNGSAQSVCCVLSCKTICSPLVYSGNFCKTQTMWVSKQVRYFLAVSNFQLPLVSLQIFVLDRRNHPVVSLNHAKLAEACVTSFFFCSPSDIHNMWFRPTFETAACDLSTVLDTMDSNLESSVVETHQ